MTTPNELRATPGMKDLIEREDASHEADIRWLALQSDHAEEPGALAALALIGLEMVQRRQEQLRARTQGA